MPTWLAYIVGAVLGVLVALVIAPLPPAPISTLLYWGGWIVFAVCVVMAILSFVRGRGTRV